MLYSVRFDAIFFLENHNIQDVFLIFFQFCRSLARLAVIMDSGHSEQEAGSTVMVGTAESQRMRKSRSKRQKTSARERFNAQDESSDRSESPRSRTPAKKKGRIKSSPIWNHCYSKEVKGIIKTFCNYCPKACWALKGSTSTAHYHPKQHHYDKLTPEV